MGALPVWYAGHFAGIGKDRLAGGGARSRGEGAFENTVVQRKYVVFRRLDQEELLHAAQLVRHLGGEVVVLRIVLGDVVKLPFVAVDHVGQMAHAHQPRPLGRRGGSNPAVVVDGAVAKHLEVLRRARGRGVGVRLVEGVRHAHAFNRPLRDAVDHRRCHECRSLRGWSVRCRSSGGTACGCRRRR